MGNFTAKNIGHWAATTLNQWVLITILQGYKSMPTTYSGLRASAISDPIKCATMTTEGHFLLDRDVIVRVDPMVWNNGFYSTYCFIQRKETDFYLILDSRGLNWFLKSLLFHMLRLSDVIHAVQPQDLFTSVDLCDAYIQVTITPEHRCFLRLVFQGQAIQFKVLFL